MNILFARVGWADYLFWQESNRELLGRINELIHDIQRSPFRGLGKPEPLRGNLQGWWSRRINSDHRLIYRIVGVDQDQRIEILACRYHYLRR